MGKALIALEDGCVAEGEAFGADGERTGEVVFNTCMTGYQEILTDPSYKGQIIAMTYPLIGNYGVRGEDAESSAIHAEGLIVKEACRYPSHHTSEMTLEEYLKRNGVIGIQGVDTRALTKRLRVKGAMKGVISTVDFDRRRLVEKAKDSPGLVGRDLVREVTCRTEYRWPRAARGRGGGMKRPSYRVVAVDCGAKFNIMRMLAGSGCDVTVVPASTGARRILDLAPDGVCLSNGPGDPAAVEPVIQTVRSLIGKVPIFGICLGHQILGLALGGKTYKLKFGHRGANHPVKDLRTGAVAITSQNHGFCVDSKTLDPDKVEITHINLNDRTLEGMRHRTLPLFSVQYHPEASAGPHDSRYLFDEFIEMIRRSKIKN